VTAPRTRLAIPAVALACAAIAAAAGQPIARGLALAALGAALAAAVRAYAGATLAATLAAVAAGLLGALAAIPHPAVRGELAAAGALFAIAELARPAGPDASPWPALATAALAAALDPSWVALAPIASLRLVVGPWPRPRWAIALPIALAIAGLLAIAAACAHGGALAALWRAWAGDPPHAIRLAVLAHRTGDAVGPLVATAALAGLASCAARGARPAHAAIAAAFGVVAVGRLAGAPTPGTLALAALFAGVAIARLAALVRPASGQAAIGAAAGALVLVAPAWSLIG